MPRPKKKAKARMARTLKHIKMLMAVLKVPPGMSLLEGGPERDGIALFAGGICNPKGFYIRISAFSEGQHYYHTVHFTAREFTALGGFFIEGAVRLAQDKVDHGAQQIRVLSCAFEKDHALSLSPPKSFGPLLPKHEGP